MIFVTKICVKILVFVLVISPVSPTSRVDRFTITDYCGSLDPLPVGNGSVVLHIPANIDGVALCRVKFANIKPRSYAVKASPADPDSNVTLCNWIQLKFVQDFSYTTDMCLTPATANRMFYVNVRYGSILAPQRGTIPSGVNLVFTPFHYLACQWREGDDPCRDKMEDCHWFKRYLKYCKEESEYFGSMSYYCKSSCRFCRPKPDTCKSVHVNCYKDAKDGECELGNSGKIGRRIMDPCSANCGLCREGRDLESCCHYDQYETLAGVNGTFHVCDMHRCLPTWLVCDGVMNCADESDEVGCPEVVYVSGKGLPVMATELVVVVFVLVIVMC